MRYVIAGDGIKPTMQRDLISSSGSIRSMGMVRQRNII